MAKRKQIKTKPSKKLRKKKAKTAKVKLSRAVPRKNLNKDLQEAVKELIKKRDLLIDRAGDLATRIEELKEESARWQGLYERKGNEVDRQSAAHTKELEILADKAEKKLHRVAEKNKQITDDAWGKNAKLAVVVKSQEKRIRELVEAANQAGEGKLVEREWGDMQNDQTAMREMCLDHIQVLGQMLRRL